MTTLNIDKIVEYRNTLKENELKELKELFPIGDDKKFFNWIKLCDVTTQFPELSYKLKYSELERCYYLTWYVDGVLDYYEVVNKNSVKKCKTKENGKMYLYVKRDIIGSYLKWKEFVK